MTDFIGGATGFYFMAFVAAIAGGLVPTTRSRRGKTSVVLITIVFLIAAFAYAEIAPWAALIYVSTLLTTGILAEVNELSASPLLVNEPYWRKVSLLVTHQRTVRAAATDEARETV